MDAAARDELAIPAAGLFAPDSITWRVNRETVLLLGGPRALLLQLAHPLVAAGVADHSDFLRDPLGRLWRTLDTMLRIVFGDAREVRAALARLEGVHERVHGTLGDATAHYPRGTPYDARDPELARWVHATLVDSALAAYERFVGPLTDAAREAFWSEARPVARLLGIPAELVPPTLDAFRAYCERMLAGPELEITPSARRLADAVLHPPIRGLPRFAGGAASVLSLALLPSAIRARYGFRWSRRRERAADAAARAIRRTLPLVPAVVRYMPHARRGAAGARTT